MTASELRRKRKELSSEVRKLTREIELKEKQIITEFPKYYKLTDDLNLTENKQHAYHKITYYNNTDKSYHCESYRILKDRLSTSNYSFIAHSMLEENYKEITFEEFTKAKNIIMSANDDINSEKSKLNNVIIDITHRAKRELGML